MKSTVTGGKQLQPVKADEYRAGVGRGEWIAVSVPASRNQQYAVGVAA